MNNMIFVGDIVEANGKTVKENNQSIQHTLPLGSLVEINCDCCDEHGLRLFVAKYERDCDGTPLYGLSIKKNYMKEVEKFSTPSQDPTEELIRKMLLERLQGSLSTGWSEESLILIS